MRTIWRQGLRLIEKQTITAPGLRRVLSVDNRRGRADEPEAWFEVDTDAAPRSLDIFIVGTGGPFPDELHYGLEQYYLGHLIQGPYIWHLYSVETPGNKL